jgi:hypothetical protein
MHSGPHCLHKDAVQLARRIRHGAVKARLGLSGWAGYHAVCGVYCSFVRDLEPFMSRIKAALFDAWEREQMDGPSIDEFSEVSAAPVTPASKGELTWASLQKTAAAAISRKSRPEFISDDASA